MSYVDDISGQQKPSKIPYDDTPISRPTKSQSSSGRRFGGSLQLSSKVFVLFLAVSVIINIGLCISTIYFILNGVSKTVNVYYNDIVSTGEISSAAATTARWSTITVSAGLKSDYSSVDEDNFTSATYSHGAGIIYSIDRITGGKRTGKAYFVTCYHVIEGYENEVYIMIPSSTQPIKVSKLGYTSHYDVAVLEYEYASANDPIEECTGIFDAGRTPQYAESYNLALGEQVFAVGNPLSGGISVTSGLVSRLNTFVRVDNNNYLTREIQTSAEINSGNSGGGLYDSEGKFVGLMNSKLQSYNSKGTSVTVSGMAYAIPGTLATSIAKSIISESKHEAKCVNIGVKFGHGTLKTLVQVGNKFVEKYEVVVSSVSAGGSASNILKNGDIVTSFTYTDRDGVTHEVQMYNEYVFEDISFNVKSGSDIIFKITRPSERKDYTLTVRDVSNFQAYS